MAFNAGTPTKPLWWTFFTPVISNTTYWSRADLCPLCVVNGNDTDQSERMWDPTWTTYEDKIGTTYDGHSPFTRTHAIAYRMADMIETIIAQKGATLNAQIAVCLQIDYNNSDAIMHHPSDGLGLTATTPDWDDNTVFSANGQSAYSTKFGNWAAALATELTARSIGLQPGFLLLDHENALNIARFIGGNHNGNFNDGTVSGGNLEDQVADARAATETILRASGDAVKGGATNRTLSGISWTAPGSYDADHLQAAQITTTREWTALRDSIYESAIDALEYANIRAAFPNANGLGTPTHCGNYRFANCDHPAYPQRIHNTTGAPGSGGDLDAYHAVRTDVYGNCNCHVLYPTIPAATGDPDNIDFGGWNGFTGFDNGRSVQRNHFDAQLRALENGSTYAQARNIPWLEHPDNSRGYGGDYSRPNYRWHAEDFEYFIFRGLGKAQQGKGFCKGIIWQNNPTLQTFDATKLAARLDAAYSRLGLTGVS